MTSQTQNVPSSPFPSLPIDLEQLQHFREHRAREIFHSLLQDPIRVAEAVQAVAALTPNKRKLLVMDHVIWRHVTASNRTYRRLFVNESSRRCDGQEALLNPHILANRTRNRGECVLLVRAQAKLNNALEHCMGHIGCDTVEISDLRMRETAVRALLYFEAQKIQEDEEIRRVTGSHPSNSHPMGRTSSSLVITPMLPPIAPSLPATNPFEGKVNGSSGCYEPSAIVPAQSSMDSSYIPLQASRAGPSQGQGSRSASSPSSSPLLPPLQQKVKNASSRRALLGNKPHSTIHTHRSVPSATLAKMAACARPKGMESSSAKEGTLEQPNLSSQCLRVKSKHDVNVSSILWSLESYELRDVVLRLRRLV